MNKSELVRVLQARASNTPYVIEQTGDGFKLTLNIVDKKWYTILQKNGIKHAFTIEAKVNESSKVVTTTDTLNEINWQAGGVQPALGGRVSTMKGEVHEVGFRKDLGVSEQGEVGKVLDYTYDTSEAKKWLGETLRENGYKKGMGSAAKTGITVAIVLGVILILPLLLLPLLLIIIF